MKILDRVRKGTTIADWVAIGISIGAVLFTGLNYRATTFVNLPDVKYYYTISRDLKFKEGFDIDRCPEIQNSDIVDSAYYLDIKEERTELEEGTRFLWLVIRNEGEGRAKGCWLRLIGYMFENKWVQIKDTLRRTSPGKYEHDRYWPLPENIKAGHVIVLLCEVFVPSEGKDPDEFVKEDKGFKGFTVETRIKSIFGRWPFTAGFNENHAREMWPRYSNQ